MPRVICHVLYATSYMPRVICHVLYATCYMPRVSGHVLVNVSDKGGADTFAAGPRQGPVSPTHRVGQILLVLYPVDTCRILPES